MSAASADAANTRRCSRCSKPIEPDAELLARALSMVLERPGTLFADELRQGAAAAVSVAAWRNGYCSTTCLASDAVKDVIDGRAWWSSR